MTEDLGIAERLQRKMGRPARTQSVATRFTLDEEKDLLKAAEKQGQTLREWTRETLLREARRPDHDPVFTEIIATRFLLNNALKAVLLGEKWTPEQYKHLSETVRKEKKKTAEEVMRQYAQPDNSDQ